MIDTVVATADAVAGRKRSRKRIGISVDEWNVWHQTANPHHVGHAGPFKHAPALAEDEHTVADALVVGCLLITLLRHADRVKIGCLAQLVNVIPPIRTLDGGPAWRQTTLLPVRARRSLRARDRPARRAGRRRRARGDRGARRRRSDDLRRQPLAGRVVARAVLRDLDGVTEHLVLADADLGASNTAERPDRVLPARVSGAGVSDGVLKAVLPSRSWNVLRLT